MKPMTRFQRDAQPARASRGKGSAQDIADLWRNAEGPAERVGVAMGTLLVLLLVAVPVGYLIYLVLSDLFGLIFVVLMVFLMVFIIPPIVWLPLVLHPEPPPKPAGASVSDREWKRLWTSAWQRGVWREYARQTRRR